MSMTVSLLEQRSEQPLSRSAHRWNEKVSTSVVRDCLRCQDISLGCEGWADK